MRDFMDVLEALCREQGVRGAVFVDHEGECIQQATADPTLTKYELSVAGAYVAPILSGLMKCESLRLRGSDGDTYIKVVEGSYAVVVLAHPKTLSGRLQLAVNRAAVELKSCI